MCNENCDCNGASCCKDKCNKKCCKVCFLLTTVAISFVVSLFVVKFFAPCVVKKAMMNDFVEKQMDFAMMKGMMYHHKMHMDKKMEHKKHNDK